MNRIANQLNQFQFALQVNMESKQKFGQYVNEYKQSQRFNSQAQNNSQTTRQIIKNSTGEPLVPSAIQQIMIEIGLDGKRFLVNQNKQKAIILPKPNKFFESTAVNLKANDSAEVHNEEVQYQKLKNIYNKFYKVSMASIIYRYQFLQIQLFSQMYADKISVEEKRVIEGEFYSLKNQKIQSRLCFFGFIGLYVSTRRLSWMKLTRNNYLWLIGLSYFGLGLVKSNVDYKNYIFTSILKYNKVYEKVINQYENDYNIQNL